MTGAHAPPPNEQMRPTSSSWSRRDFIAATIDTAGAFGAPAIIGSMQGRSSPDVPRHEALDLLADALATLGKRAVGHGQVVGVAGEDPLEDPHR